MLNGLPPTLELGYVDRMALAVGDILLASTVLNDPADPWLQDVYRPTYLRAMSGNVNTPLAMVVPGSAEKPKAIGGEQGLYAVSMGFQFFIPHLDDLPDTEPSYAGIVDLVHSLFFIEKFTEDTQPLLLCVPRFGSIPLAEQSLGFRSFDFLDSTPDDEGVIEVFLTITGDWRVGAEQLRNPPAQVIP